MYSSYVDWWTPMLADGIKGLSAQYDLRLPSGIDSWWWYGWSSGHFDVQ